MPLTINFFVMDGEEDEKELDPDLMEEASPGFDSGDETDLL
jgi:hypothetical protein